MTIGLKIMRLGNLSVNKRTGEVSWLRKEKKNIVSINNVHQAMATDDQEVIVLSGKGEFPSILSGYTPEGEQTFHVPPPKGYTFSYLTMHPEVGVAVVCGGDERKDGWYDWHFAINPHDGSMKRHCPSK